MAHDSVRWWLRLEGLALLVASTVWYARQGQGWTLFAVLLLVPDISMIGYLAGPRVGAILYNVVHSLVLPIALALMAVAFDWPHAMAYVLIWTAHIGFDRTLGYGLKYPTAFGDTHLGKMGRA